MPDPAGVVAADPVLAASVAVGDADGLTPAEVLAMDRPPSAEDVAADLVEPVRSAWRRLLDRYGVLVHPWPPRYERDRSGRFTGRAVLPGVSRTVSPAAVRAAGEALDRWAREVADAAAVPPVTTPPPEPADVTTPPHDRSLLKAGLARLRVRRGLDRLRVDLDEAATRRLLDRLRRDSTAAADRIGARLPGGGPGAALHALLTRKRFRKGPAAHLTPDAVAGAVAPYAADGAPVPLMLQGFPFKQRDNGLKAAGRRPDLGELGTLLRLTELRRALTRAYPPGLTVTIVSDGGYYRPRPAEDVAVYLAGLDDHLKLLDATDAVTVTTRAELVGDRLSPAEFATRAELTAELRAVIAAATAPARRRWNVQDATGALERGPLARLTAPVLTFGRIFTSLLSSEPIDYGDGTPARPEWARTVLADPFDTAAGGVGAARRRLLDRTWTDAVGYLAVLAADRRLGVDERVFTGVRLATGAPRPGLAGFAYLGGSTLLPWHGTGCAGADGLVASGFRIALRDRCFVPVHTPSTGADQPFMMVPCAVTVDGERGRDLAEGYGVRLRAR